MRIFQTKRMKVSVLSGVILGLVCIIGALLRSEGAAAPLFLFALWFNRLLMGMVIGLISERTEGLGLVLRGALIGLLVSFAFFSAAGYGDIVSFLAGIVYGVIIELAARRYAA